MKIRNLVFAEALKVGVDITTIDADYVLWEETGYPCFWRIGVDGGTPLECLRTQLRAFFAGLER